MRLLFITSNRLGDAVLSTAVLNHFVNAHPGIRITVACGPVAAPIFAAVPGLERIIEMPKQKRGGHWWKLWKSVVLNWWDIIVDLRGSATAFVLPGWRRYVLQGNDDSVHRVEQLGRLIGINPPPSPKIWVRPEDIARAKQLLPIGQKPILAVGPTANWGGKTWPADRFVEVIGYLRSSNGPLPDAHVLIAGAPNEKEAAEAVIEAVPSSERTLIFGDEHLLTLQACLEQVDLYVGNDSGLMHMAAVAGVPTLGLFGPSRDEHYGPWSVKGRAVRTDWSYDKIIATRTVDHTSQQTLMGTLSVEKVNKAAEDLLASVSAGGR